MLVATKDFYNLGPPMLIMMSLIRGPKGALNKIIGAKRL